MILALGVAQLANAQQAGGDKALLEAQKKSILDAVKKADEEVKKAPTKPRPWLNRASAYVDLASFPDSSVAISDMEAPNKVVESINEAIKLDTKDGKKGSVAKDAEKMYDDKKVYNAYMNIGVIKYQGKDYNTSYTYMAAASKYNPKDTTAAMYTGVVAQMAKKDNEAQEAYERYLSIGGKDIAIIYGLSQIYKSKKMENQALELIDRGIAMYPNNKDLKNEKFNLYIGFNRTEDAIKTLKQTIAADPQDVLSMVNLGLLYENKMSGIKDEASKIREKNFQIEDLDRKIKSQNEAIQEYNNEINKNKAKLKTAQPKAKTQINAQIKGLTDRLNEEVKSLDLFKSDREAAIKEAGDPAANKAKYDALQAQIKAIRDEVPQYYEGALKVDPNNFDALYQLGALNYNDAADIKRSLNNMDMETYKKEGKAVEERVLAKHQEALPFFERAYKIKKDEDLKEVLKNIYKELKQEDKINSL